MQVLYSCKQSCFLMLRRANGIALLDDLREMVELGNGIVASPSPGPGVLDGEDSPTNPQVPLLHLPSPVIEYRVQLVSKVSPSESALPRGLPTPHTTRPPPSWTACTAP